MNRVLPTKTRMWLGGVVCIGVAVAHWLAYALAAPDPHGRHELLAATGHAYWPYFVAIALGAGVTGLAGLAVQRLRDPGADGVDAATLHRFAAVRLAVLQLGAFMVLEVAERVVTGTGLGSLLAEPAVLLGLVLQLPLALAGATLLVVYAEAVVRIARRRARPAPRAESSPWPIARVPEPRLAVACGGATLRGPPSL